MAEDSPSESNIASSHLMDEPNICSIDSIFNEIQARYDKDTAAAFMRLLITKELPKNPQPLIEFFTNRRDVISQTCLHALESKS